VADATLSREARTDLDAAWDYLATYSPDAADRFLDEFWTSAELHARFPRTGRARDDLHAGMRSFVVGRYVAFFLPDPAGIRIVRVLHGSRNIDHILRGDEVDE
jgi:toxin ParE1/3/4